MNWITDLFTQHTVAGSMLALSAVIALGLALGTVRVFGITLGIAGVLFAGLFLGHLGVKLDHHVLEFVREFGLILFVFTIGMQVGPGFFASLKRQGLKLNLLAASIVVLGIGVTGALILWGGLGGVAGAGLLPGAVTNTPSLAAAGQALRQIPSVDETALKLPALAYAIAYPFGIVGTILAMLFVRTAFRVDVAAERKALEDAQDKERTRLSSRTFEVTNPNLVGVAIGSIPGLAESQAVISRLQRGATVAVPRADTLLATGDLLYAVGPGEKLENLRLVLGRVSEVDLKKVQAPLESRRVIVTHKQVLGKSIPELHLLERLGVTVTRLTRGDQEFTATAGLRLQFADTLMVVGENEALTAAEAELGNSFKKLNHPHIVPVFIGIGLGVLAGSLPIAVPGLPAPVKLGLAGGPLLLALFLSRLGHFGPLVWYMPLNANYLLREIGISLFLACVGLHAGDSFWSILTSGEGVRWLMLGGVITIVPLLIVGTLARAWLKMNYVSLCGLLAGSMTDPPALAFAHQMTGSEASAVSYVTVYPLVMILRVFLIQVLVLFAVG